MGVNKWAAWVDMIRAAQGAQGNNLAEEVGMIRARGRNQYTLLPLEEEAATLTHPGNLHLLLPMCTEQDQQLAVTISILRQINMCLDSDRQLLTTTTFCSRLRNLILA